MYCYQFSDSRSWEVSYYEYQSSASECTSNHDHSRTHPKYCTIRSTPQAIVARHQSIYVTPSRRNAYRIVSTCQLPSTLCPHSTICGIYMCVCVSVCACNICRRTKGNSRYKDSKNYEINVKVNVMWQVTSGRLPKRSKWPEHWAR